MNHRIEHASGANIVPFRSAICPACQKAFTPRAAIQSVCGLNCFSVMKQKKDRNNMQCKQARVFGIS
jgi:hypothetical protein